MRAGATWAGSILLATAAYVSLAALVDPYFLFAFEADSHRTIELVQAFAAAPATRHLPEPLGGIPYLDAQYWIYLVGYAAAKGARVVGLLDADALPTNQSLIIFAMRYVNVLAHVGAVAILFLSAAQLSRSVVAALVLAALFLFDPQLLGIDMLRLDRLVVFLYALVFHLSLQVVRGRRSAWIDVVLGVAAALLAGTKITSVVLLAVPAVAYAHQWRTARLGRKHIATLLVSFAVAMILTEVRFLAYGPILGRVLSEKLAEAASWGTIFPRTPYLFYNWDNFLPLGSVFMGAFLVALAGCIRNLLARKDSDSALVLTPLVIQTLVGIAAYKYPRGGYILMPMYLLVIALGVRILGDALSRASRSDQTARPTLGPAIALVLLFPLAREWSQYKDVRDESQARAESIQVTRVAPREWLKLHLPEGSRVAVFRDSEWANPPLEGLGYVVSQSALYFPYLEPDKMATFRPPAFEALERDFDAVVLNGFHKANYPWLIRKAGHDDVAAEWDAFLLELGKRYPSRRFKASSPNYQVDEVEVILLKARAPGALR